MRRTPLPTLIGLVVAAAFFMTALLAPLIAPYGMSEIVGDVWEPASAAHWLGTDNIGRDLLSRLIFGGRTTIFVALVATALAFTVGAAFGLFAAVVGGWVDLLLSRFVDLVMSIPSLIFALVVLSVMPVTTPVLIVVIGLLESTRMYRLSRAVAVDLAVMDFVEAAQLRGEGLRWVILREILPNALSPLVAEMGMRFIFVVLFISTLSFLGIGIQPPNADWGGIVKENKDGIVYGIPRRAAAGGRHRGPGHIRQSRRRLDPGADHVPERRPQWLSNCLRSRT